MTTPIHNVSWERLPDMPVAKWEPASLVIDDKLYVLGGYEDNVPKNIEFFARPV